MLTLCCCRRKFGDTYKWLFYGDDDTIFSLDAAINIASKLDHNMPYFLTDHLWWTSRDNNTHKTHHPHPGVPRCVPCNYAKNTSTMPFRAPAGCPCTPQLLCGGDEPAGELYIYLLYRVPQKYTERCASGIC
jgi:hypothetical protein